MDKKNQPMSEDAKNIIVEQRNVEVFELMELPDKIQCEICHKYTSVGHTLNDIVVVFLQVPTKKFKKQKPECHS